MSIRQYEEYLGDGVYVYLDDYGAVVLYTSNGFNETNRVVLEPAVFSQFEHWIEHVRKSEAQR